MSIADNKKAAFNYHFEERYECGLVLQGWEIKALRQGKVQLTEGYVVIRNGVAIYVTASMLEQHAAPGVYAAMGAILNSFAVPG